MMPSKKTKKIDSSSAYIWLDAEFTSLDLEEAHLLQVAVMLTDVNLKRIAPPEEDLNIFIQLDPNEKVSPWVAEHLPQLVEICRNDPQSVSIEEADKKIATYLDKYTGSPHAKISDRPVLGGNSVHNDWLLVRRFLPELTKRLHYRLLDVSALKIQWQDWIGKVAFDKENIDLLNTYLPEENIETAQAHDALFDIKASIAELAFYRAHLQHKAE